MSKQEKKTEIGRKIRELRTQRRLTQAELAAKIGIPAAAISHFETGERRPSLQNLVKLAGALSVTVDSLLGGEADNHLAGPHVDAVFRNVRGLSDDALDELVRFSNFLAQKEKSKKR